MLIKRSLVVAFVTALAAMALLVSPTANAQPPTGITIPATCTNATTGLPEQCALSLIGFQNVGGTLNAAFLLVNEATGQATRVLIPIGQLVPGTTCTILHLVIPGPITLELLGLELTIQTIDILLEARRGTLLGDLLCGLFFNSAQLPALLTGALRQGLITV